MDLLKRFKEILESKNRKKLIENAVIVIIIGIIVIIAGGVFFNKSAKTEDNTILPQNNDAMETAKITSISEQDADEEKLAGILSQMLGVGKVSVMITYTVGKENVPAYDIQKNENSTNEKDNGGGSRIISQSDYDSSVVYEDSQNGGKKPVIVKELQPVVKGVVVVAEGASSPDVRERISKAVQVLMDVPIHKVHIVERKK